MTLVCSFDFVEKKPRQSSPPCISLLQNYPSATHQTALAKIAAFFLPEFSSAVSCQSQKAILLHSLLRKSSSCWRVWGVDMGTPGKVYSCKTCGMGFSCGRVLGGHVRKHLAAERLAARDKKFLIGAEESEMVGDVVDGEHERGGHFLRTNPKKSVKSMGSNEREINSSGGTNPGGSHKKGLFAGLHAGLGGRRGERDYDGGPSIDLGTKMEACSRKSLLEEILHDYERIHPTIRKKRSIRMRCNGNLLGRNAYSDSDMSSPMFPPGGIHEDEMEAVNALLTISAVGRNWEVLQDSSTVDETKKVEGISDGFNLGISNKRRRVCNFDDVGLEMSSLPDHIGCFSISANVEEKSVELEVGLLVIDDGVEVQSTKEDNLVEEIKTMAKDVLEGERLPGLISDDDVGGDHRKMKLSDPACRKAELVFKRMGYKCKNCGNIFPTHEALGCHRAEERNRANVCSTLNSEKSGNTVNGDISSPSPVGKANKTLSHEPGLEEQNLDLAGSGEICTLGHASNGHERSPYNMGSAASGSKRSCYGDVPLNNSSPIEIFGEDRNAEVC
ncbi:hypothetical protein MLD38_034827 [Melastoma candidum]|uniref:Uncharacterized protein n=1 Tax=Melastoma candidum TaxID=119954 RepID=A0ACB9MB63_9MYRT|nr:hypothetical protein MLD38_034827 [Melastoma candidum]